MHASPCAAENRQGLARVVTESDGIVAVCLEGEFDLMNAAALDEEIGHALEDGNDVILDLSDATFIDSSVINVLMRAVKATRGTRQTIVLQLGTAAVVERVLEVAGTERVVPRGHDRQEAVRLIRERAYGL